MNKKIILDDFEKNIENEIHNFKSVPAQKRKQIENIISEAKKNKSISLRISDYDLKKLKEHADANGMKYQTFITTILHKYILNQFFEKAEVIKTFKAIQT